MKKRLSLALALAGAGVISIGADAATYTFGGSVTGRVGYGQNPSFLIGDTGAGAVYGGDLSATIARLTSKGRTSLTGTVDETETTGSNGRTQNFIAQFNQSEQFSPKLSVSGGVTYSDATNPSANYSTDSRDLVPISDVLTIGTHTRQIGGDVNFGYQMDSLDLFQGGLNVNRSTYSGVTASSYTQYGGSFGYLRTVSATTRIGFQASAVRVLSANYPTSTSYTGGLALTQKIGQRWTFQGGVNGVFQQAVGGLFKTIGFNGSFCGDYPRYTICVLGSRQSAASGIGGLRVDTQGGARLNYKLTARSTLNFETTYDVSTAKDVSLPAQRYIDSAITYSRTITPRLSAGASARYQRRMVDALGTFPASRTSSYFGTLNVTYAFGRTS